MKWKVLKEKCLKHIFLWFPLGLSRSCMNYLSAGMAVHKISVGDSCTRKFSCKSFTQSRRILVLQMTWLKYRLRRSWRSWGRDEAIRSKNTVAQTILYMDIISANTKWKFICRLFAKMIIKTNSTWKSINVFIVRKLPCSQNHNIKRGNLQ